MSINDPFGRVTHRNQRNYETLRQRLHQEGIGDARSLAKIAGNMAVLALKLTAVTLASSLLLALLFPQARGVVIVLGLLVLLWIAVSYLKMRLHLHRYRNEECNGD